MEEGKAIVFTFTGQQIDKLEGELNLLEFRGLPSPAFFSIMPPIAEALGNRRLAG
jgi:hypothetical protein